MTPTLDAALPCSSRAGSDLGSCVQISLRSYINKPKAGFDPPFDQVQNCFNHPSLNFMHSVNYITI